MTITKADRAILTQYAARRDGEKFRVTRDGELHIKGQMPNSVEHGWWFAGFAADVVADIKAGLR